MRKNCNDGFTAVELIVTLCILAVIFLIVIPLYPTVAQRMKVNVDKASAGNIANAVKSWYSDYSTDSVLKENENFLEDKRILTEDGRKSVLLSEINGLDAYMDTNVRPCSLINENAVTVSNQKFFVSLIDKGLNVAVVITVGTEGVEVNDSSTVNYDGNSNGIIYIES